MTANPEKKTTHFGYREVPWREKSHLVAKVFQSVAPKYDIMNDLMSLGLHRLWKRFTLAQTDLREGQLALDVASGTGDLVQRLAKQVGQSGKVIATDINEAMLSQGRDRLTDDGVIANAFFIQADAEHLPFIDNYFDCITLAFGLRNITDKTTALSSIYRVLKPGGKLLILEFSHPSAPLFNKIYDLYSFQVIPKLGELITRDRESYQYLVESIRKHPDQETLKAMMLECGFEDVEHDNLSGGIVALHKGYKY